MKLCRAPRRGISLLELVSVLPVITLLVMIATQVVLQLMAAGASGQGHLERTIVLGTLADQFRRDVHAAQKVTSLAGAEPQEDKPAAGLRLLGNEDSSIEYEHREGALQRRLLRNGAAVSHERFEMPGVERFRFEVPGESPAIVTLVIEGRRPEGTHKTAASGSLRIEAAVGTAHLTLESQEP